MTKNIIIWFMTEEGRRALCAKIGKIWNLNPYFSAIINSGLGFLHDAAGFKRDISPSFFPVKTIKTELRFYDMFGFKENTNVAGESKQEKSADYTD